MGDYGNDYMRREMGGQPRSKQQNRATVQQLKAIGQSHKTGLTTNLLKLFEPREPLEYKVPLQKRKCPPLTGIAQCVEKFAEPGEPEYAPPVTKGETSIQRKARIRAIRLAEGEEKVREELEKYDPANDPNIEGDPYKTLFVARVSYETTETKIKREFEAYGPIKKIRLVNDNATGKPRGYAFVEFQHTRDMKSAYKQADGRKIDNRRVIVDVERGRTVPNWRPRRLGGGLGSTRIGGDEVNQRHSGREPEKLERVEVAEVRPREVIMEDRKKTEIRAPEPEVERERPREHEVEHERERERGRERDLEKERERGRERERGLDVIEKPRERERERDRDRERDRERDRGGEPKEKERERVRERDRERDRGERSEKDRERERSDRDKDRERRYRERGDRERERPREKGHDRDRRERADRGERSHSRDRERERDRA